MRKVKSNELNNIGKLREEKGITRAEAIKTLGCGKSFLSQIECINATKSPSPELAKKMAVLYDCTLDDIYNTPKRGRPEENALKVTNF